MHPTNSTPRLGVASLIACALLIGACVFEEPAPVGTSRPDEPVAERAPSRPPSAVTALGRLEPGLGVVHVGAPAGARVGWLGVAEGEAITVGQPLARLDSYEPRKADLALQRAHLSEARQALRRAEALAPLAAAAQAAEVRRLEADSKLAEADLRRTRSLVGDEVLPTRELEHQESVAEQSRARLEQADTALELEERRRHLDIRAARALVASGEAAVKSAEVAFSQTEIRSPVEGTVLRLEVLEGEPTDGGPILRLGETIRMFAVAEIYETDARFVRVGQKASITSPALPQALEGTVELMGSLVDKNDVLSIDPAADSDARVIEARIRLDDAETAARFVHLQVDVRIEIASGS